MSKTWSMFLDPNEQEFLVNTHPEVLAPALMRMDKGEASLLIAAAYDLLPDFPEKSAELLRLALTLTDVTSLLRTVEALVSLRVHIDNAPEEEQQEFVRLCTNILKGIPFEEVMENPDKHQHLVNCWCIASYLAMGFGFPLIGQPVTRTIYVYQIDGEGIKYQNPLSESGWASRGSFLLGHKPGFYGGDSRCLDLRFRLATPQEYAGLSIH